jgi:hypothetical protein
VKFHVHREIIFSYGTQSKLHIKQTQARARGKLGDKVMTLLLFSSIFVFFLISRHESREVNALMIAVLMLMVTTTKANLFPNFSVQ